MLEANQLLKWAIVGIFALLVIAYGVQGGRSAYRLYPSSLGYQVRAFDVTPRWIGTKNLLYSGINPYSEQGRDLIEEAFFGRPLKPEDKDIVKDKQHFAYPLYVILLYAPTVVMSFPNALLVIWMASFLMFVASIWIWFRLAGFISSTNFLVLTACFLTWPQVYIGFQARQPLFFVLFFVSLGSYLIVYGKKRLFHVAAGIFLFLSTVKPQNSLMAVAYLLFLWLPSMGDKNRTKSIWLGFVIMSIASLLFTHWLVPGWISDFLQGISRYRSYAGATGAESLWGKGMLSVSMPIVFLTVAMAMGIVSYRVKRHEVHLIVFCYVLILQGLVFPSHLYTLMMGIPLAGLCLRRLACQAGKSSKCGTYMISVVFILTFYGIYKYWIHILSEAPLRDEIMNVVLRIRDVLPSVPLYVPIPLMLVLGISLFIEAISEGIDKVSFKKLVYFRS